MVAGSRARARPDRAAERATALMLAPALVLVLIVLAAIAVDLALVDTAHRSAYRSLSAAADDAAAMADSRHLQLTGEVRLDPAAAERVARAHLGVLDGVDVPGYAAPAFEVLDADVRADTASGTVDITATVRVEHVFLGAVPGTADATDIEVQARGRMLP